ncbi:ATP-binding protein [Streptomyces sp. OM5714]|uniref:ATP-binding protein n=1 Tax=Streptomyces sp. OM5714 TaxID=2602736 RepID=UPI0019D9C9D7|nr:ATP-binding protein [Streptomyces sp. OM5714]KAF2775259.1 hypothetical protein STPH1_7446 [Streptomyces sp. OM5714]
MSHPAHAASSAAHMRASINPRPSLAGHEVVIRRDPASTPQRLTRADATWPARLRRIVRAALAHWDHPDLAEAAGLLTTELATNAFRHGRGRDIGFRFYLTDVHLVIEVDDGSPCTPVLRCPGPADESGRGLLLVQALAEAWGVSTDGTTTWCTLPLTA